MAIDQIFLDKLTDLRSRAEEITGKFPVEEKKREATALEAQTVVEGFWSDPDRAKKITQELAALHEEVSQVEQLQRQLSDLSTLLDLYHEETVREDAEGTDRGLEHDLHAAAKNLEVTIDALELQFYLSGKYDRYAAIFSIHSGQGGTEAMDWARMLQRMYTRYFERKKWKFQLVEESRGDEAGIKSCAFFVYAPNAYGYLKREAGAHRLVRLSPFNADNLRQTSFCGVEVLPLIDENDTELTVNPDDLEWKFSRAGGHGGQNVNKVNTAVLLRHIPSGLVVEAREERYQEQNKKIALSILKAKLIEAEERKRQEEIAAVKGEHKIAGWGNQIRNYVLHPYHLVKDLRTGVETSDTEGVLDGDLDLFIAAEMRL